MPIYRLKDSETGEIEEHLCSYDEIKKMEADSNGRLTIVVGAPRIVSGVGSQSVKVDNGFREVMSKIKETHTQNTIKDY